MDFFEPELYWEDRLSCNPGLRGVGFLGLGTNYNRWLYAIRRTVFLREVIALGLSWPSTKIFDVGSGTGFYIRLWQEIGAGLVVGSDLTGVAVRRLKQQFSNTDFVQLDVGEALSENLSNQFDVVSAFDMLFHITDDKKYRTAIQNAHSLLRPGGWFLFSDQLLHSPTRRSVHMVERSMSDVLTTLHEAGFEIVRRRPVFVVMNCPVDSRSSLQNFTWRALMYPIFNGGVLSEAFGYAIGSLLYPIDALLTRMLSEGPSTEMVICRRV